MFLRPICRWICSRELISAISKITFFYSEAYGRKCIDCQATAIKNATMINFVGERFLKEVVDDYFLDRPLVPMSVRNEVKAKYTMTRRGRSSMLRHPTCIRKTVTISSENTVLTIPSWQPSVKILWNFRREQGCRSTPMPFCSSGPPGWIRSRKGLSCWKRSSGTSSMFTVMPRLPSVADGVGNDRTHVDILGRIAYKFRGKNYLSAFPGRPWPCWVMRRPATVFGASLYEPCGQIDQVGNLCEPPPPIADYPAAIMTRSGTDAENGRRPARTWATDFSSGTMTPVDSGCPRKELAFTATGRDPETQIKRINERVKTEV